MAATLAAMFASVCASAQSTSSMTIYGIIDTGVEYIDKVGAGSTSLTRIPGTTGSVPSRLGFRGTEELGGGMKAVMNLEHGFSVDQGTTNQGGRMWGRVAYVGLTGQWGAILLGRQMTQLGQGFAGDTFGPAIYAYSSLDTYIPNARYDNSVSYTIKAGNLTAATTVSLGRDTVSTAAAGGCAGETSDSKACRGYSGSLRYETQDWGAATSFDQLRGGAGTGSPMPLSSQSDKRVVVSGFVRVVGAKIGAGVMHRHTDNAAVAERNLYFAGVSYPWSNWLFDAQYSRLDLKASPDDADLLTLRALYNLSKRTALYATVGRIWNKGASTVALSTGAPTGASPAAGVDQNGVMFGIRHQF